MKTTEDIKTKDCVGCGFCCKKAPCALANRIFGATESCPALKWDEENGRYWCDICKKDNIISAKYRVELYIGEGCCCGLNSDRNNIRPPIPKHKTYSKEVKALLYAMARDMFCSGDALWLTINAAARELNDPDFAKWALHWVRENRSQRTAEFMGEMPPNK